MLSLNDRLTFGQHEGKLLRWVINHDPDYILWCEENIEWFEIDANAQDALEWAMADVWDEG